MKRKFALLLLVFAFVMACSTDGEDDVMTDDLASMEDEMMDDDTDDASDDDSSDDDSSDDDSSDDDTSSDDNADDSDDSSDDDSNDDNSNDDTDDGSDDGDMDESPLIGLWIFNEIRLEEGVDDFILSLLFGSINDLAEEDCELLTFEFKADGMVDVGSRIGDLDLESTTLSCPENLDTVTTTWSLEGEVLTLATEGEEDQEILLSFEDENTLIIQGEDAAGEEFTELDLEGSEAVFVRQQTDS